LLFYYISPLTKRSYYFYIQPVNNIKQNQKLLNTNEVRRITGAPNWLINYLVAERLIPVIRLGRGVLRLYPAEAIAVIENYLSKSKRRRGGEDGA